MRHVTVVVLLVAGLFAAEVTAQELDRQKLQIQQMQLEAQMHELEGNQHLLRAKKLRIQIQLLENEKALAKAAKKLRMIERLLAGTSTKEGFDALRSKAIAALAAKRFDDARRYAQAALAIKKDEQVSAVLETATAVLRKQLAAQLKQVLRPVYDKIVNTRKLRYQAGGELHRSAGELARTLQQIEKLAADKELAGIPELWTTLGEGWQAVGALMRAHSAFGKALALTPGDPWINFYLGRLLVHRGILLGATDKAVVGKGESDAAMREAATHLKKINGWKGSDAMTRTLARAYLALAEGKTAGVTAACTDGLKNFASKPGAEEFWMLQGVTQEGKGRDAALGAALKGCPHDARSHFLLGGGMKSIGKNAEATKLYLQALSDQPWMWQAWVNYAIVLSRQGDKMKALASLNQAHEMVGSATATGKRILKLINHLKFGR